MPYTVSAHLVLELVSAPCGLEVLLLLGLVQLRSSGDALLDHRLETPDQALWKTHERSAWGDKKSGCD